MTPGAVTDSAFPAQDFPWQGGNTAVTRMRPADRGKKRTNAAGTRGAGVARPLGRGQGVPPKDRLFNRNL